MPKGKGHAASGKQRFRLSQEAIAAIVRLGSLTPGAEEEELETLDALLPRSICFGPADWADIANSLTVPDHALLVLGLTIVDNEIRPCGSVAGVIWTFQALDKRHPGLGRVVSDWVLRHTSNQWAPSGSTNSAARQGAALEKFKKRRAFEATPEELERQRVLAARRIAERERKIHHRKKSDVRHTVRNEFLEELKSLTVAESLFVFVNDQVRPVDYYPDTLGVAVTDDLLDELGHEFEFRLQSRLSGKRRGAWRELQKRVNRRQANNRTIDR